MYGGRLSALFSGASLLTITVISVSFLSVSSVRAQTGQEQELQDTSKGFTLGELDKISAGPAGEGRDLSNTSEGQDIYLNVVVNGVLNRNVFAFRQKANGDFIVREKDLKKIGLVFARAARIRKHWVDLSALPNVEYRYDFAQEALEFTVTDESALLPYTIDLNEETGRSRRSGDEEEGKPRSDLAAVLNYNIYTDSGSEHADDLFDFDGVSGNLDGRISSKIGTFNHSQLLTYSRRADDVYRSVRLDSYWSYSDPDRLVTYRAGDLVSRSLPWSRSVRLGGFQVRRNFGIRPDLVTIPLPELSGSVAVPSAVDLYLNNAKRVSENVPTGPFSLTNMPIISGGNTARLVVRDAQGRETVKEVSFFGSSDLLAKGLLDFSFEAGMPRRSYGTRSSDYDGNFFASGTARYGLTSRLTVEGHAEAGPDLFNGGAGVAFSLWDFGMLSLAGSGSSYGGESGQQVAATLQLQKWGFSFSARTQHTYGEYNDISSVVSRRMNNRNRFEDWGSAYDLAYSDQFSRGTFRPAKTINQVSLGIPLKFDPATLNLNYTEVDNWNGRNRYAGLSISRSFGTHFFAYANAFQDLEQSKSYSIFAGLSYSFDRKYSAMVSTDINHGGLSVTSQLKRQMGSEIGDYGWQLLDTEGKKRQRGVSGSYRAPFAAFAGSVEQYSESYRATAEMEGALVIADGGILPSNRVQDSFAVIDVGAPGVSVNYQNSYYGKTGRTGKIVVPNLSSYYENRLGIDMETLPLDTMVTETDAVVVPAYQSGIVQKFGGAVAADYAYLSFVDEKGGYIEIGSYAQIVGTDIDFDIAYDGMGLVSTKGVKFPLKIMITRPDGTFCQSTMRSSDAGKISTGAHTLTCVPVSQASAGR